MPTLLGIHKKIDGRTRHPFVFEIETLKEQLRQRDAVLWNILSKLGKQTIAYEELIGFKNSCCIQCTTLLDGSGVVFEAIDEKGNNDATEKGNESGGDKPEHQGDVGGAEAQGDGA